MAKPKKTGHKSHDRIMEQDYEAKQRASEGHNSNMVNPEIQEIFSKHEAIQADIKTLQKDQKALRVRAKDEFSIPTRVFTILIGMRKLDPNTRAELESSISDTNAMLGYQMALDLVQSNEKGEAQDPMEAARRKVVSINQPMADEED